ncbi:hypothetical protein KY363_00660 [Candidatus Woesearchaeota archaeon]|nr:hypothetical protein [Candidatus Woesearchaeota archaeon]
MVESHSKNKMLMIELMLAIGVIVFVGAIAIDRTFPTPQVSTDGEAVPIVGFVPVEIKSQPIDLSAETSSAFILFTEKEEQFSLTSLRLTGEVTGTGRAEIVLDNGLGQELLIYSNIRQKTGNLITGFAVDAEGETLPEDAKITDVDTPSAWMLITKDKDTSVEGPKTDLDGKRTEEGPFQNTCVDTCYMNMKMQKGLYYRIKVRLDPGTTVNINEMKYMLEV